MILECFALLIFVALPYGSSGAHPNPYHILGVSRTDSVEEFKSAFRNLAKKWHPDKSSQIEVFDHMRKAFDVLTNADKRNYYDRIGRYPPSKQNHVSVDIQDYAIQKYAAVSALHLYNHDPDRFSQSTLLTEETYSLLVESDVTHFGSVWIIKLYANRCHGCSAISPFWESLVQEYQGWISFGRINYDLSVGLVRALDLRSIPEIFAVTRARTGKDIIVTPLLNGDLDRMSKDNFVKILSSLQRPNNFSIIESKEALNRFLSGNKDDVKVVFSSSLHREVPVSLLTFMFRPDLPNNVRYAFVGNAVTQSGPVLSVSVWRDAKEEIISKLSNWESLLSIEMGSHVVPILKQYSAPVFPKLTYDNFYDICYSADVVCVIIIADSEEIARNHFDNLRSLASRLKVSDPESRVRIGWIDGSKQHQFVDHFDQTASFRVHKVGFCVIRPRLQTVQVFSGLGSNPDDHSQVETWLNAAITALLESKELPRSAIPFLQPEDSRTSMFPAKMIEFFEWGWYMLNILLYFALAFAAILLLFLGPSLM